MKPLYRNALHKITCVLLAAAIALTVITSSAPIFHADEQDDIEAKIELSKKRQSELSQKIKDTQGDISKEEENQQAINEQIEEVQSYLSDLSDLIGIYEDQIGDLENEIAMLEAEIAIQEKKIEDKQDNVNYTSYLYGQSLRSIYLNGNDSIASIILGSTDFFDMLMRMELIKRVASYNDGLIQSLHEYISELEAAELELENQEASLEETKELTEQKKSDTESKKSDWDSKLKELEELYSQSEKIQQQLQYQEQVLQSDLSKARQEQEAFNQQLEEIIRQKARKEYMGDLPQGTFLWPAPGNYLITSHYGPRSINNHKGIDIGCSMGSEITAANSGVVIEVYNGCTHNYGKQGSCGCGGGFGNHIIIDHGGGYATLYAHLTNAVVTEGQQVSTGEVIGYSGSTGWSTGPHLHFEVRVNGVRSDPESFDLKKY